MATILEVLAVLAAAGALLAWRAPAWAWSGSIALYHSTDILMIPMRH